jgi:hypothetical protein
MATADNAKRLTLEVDETLSVSALGCKDAEVRAEMLDALATWMSG